MQEQKTAIQARNKDTHLQIAFQHRDTPLPPVEDMERLHNLDPEYAKWVLKVLGDEAVARRERQDRVDLYQHTEKMRRIFGATLSIVVGFGSSIALAHFEAYTAAAVAVGGTLLGIVGCFIGTEGSSRSKKKQPPKPPKEEK